MNNYFTGAELQVAGVFVGFTLLLTVAFFGSIYFVINAIKKIKSEKKYIYFSIFSIFVMLVCVWEFYSTYKLITIYYAESVLKIATVCVTFPILLLIASLGAIYFVIRNVKRIKEGKKYLISSVLSVFVLFICLLQFYSTYNFARAFYHVVSHKQIKNIDKEACDLLIKAGSFSPFVSFKAYTYEHAANLYEAINTKETFDAEKLIRYYTLAARYKNSNNAKLMTIAPVYGYYDEGIKAALNVESYYWAAYMYILKNDYPMALFYANKGIIEKNKKAKQCDASLYTLRAIIYKNFNHDKLADEDYKKALELCSKDACKDKVKHAFENYKTYYNDKNEYFKKLHIDSFGY